MELTLRINEETSIGRKFLEKIKTLIQENKEVEIIETSDKSPYNPEFVKMIKEAEERGNYKTVNPDDIWESLGLR